MKYFTFIENVLQEKLQKYKFSNEEAKLSNDEGRETYLPVFDSNDIFTALPENGNRNEAQREAISEWRRSGILLIKNMLGKVHNSKL